MKTLKILTLAATLALGAALSAQTQSQTTTQSDQYTNQSSQSNQYTTQSTDQMSAPAAPDNDMQSSTSTYTNSNPAADWNATNDGSNNRHVSNRLTDIQNDSGGN